MQSRPTAGTRCLPSPSLSLCARIAVYSAATLTGATLKIQAMAFPGEDPKTLPTPADVARRFVDPAPSWTEIASYAVYPISQS